MGGMLADVERTTATRMTTMMKTADWDQQGKGGSRVEAVVINCSESFPPIHSIRSKSRRRERERAGSLAFTLCACLRASD